MGHPVVIFSVSTDETVPMTKTRYEGDVGISDMVKVENTAVKYGAAT